jgi:hypothetical protein
LEVHRALRPEFPLDVLLGVKDSEAEAVEDSYRLDAQQEKSNRRPGMVPALEAGRPAALKPPAFQLLTARVMPPADLRDAKGVNPTSVAEVKRSTVFH